MFEVFFLEFGVHFKMYLVKKKKEFLLGLFRTLVAWSTKLLKILL